MHKKRSVVITKHSDGSIIEKKYVLITWFQPPTLSNVGPHFLDLFLKGVGPLEVWKRGTVKGDVFHVKIIVNINFSNLPFNQN